VVEEPGRVARADGTDLTGLDEALAEHGALHLTGLGLRTAAHLAALRDALGWRPVAPAEPIAPRRHLGDGVWTLPEWPAEREQCLHHEGAYAPELPRALLLGCVEPARDGGRLLLADTRRVLAALPPALTDRFATSGWQLVRTFRPHFGMPWAVAFGTGDRPEVDRICAERGIAADWEPDGVLRTSRRRPAVVTHPGTGERCWVNDVAFLSRWSVEPAERRLLMSAFGERGLPFDTASGDGARLAEADYDAILDAYGQETVRLGWRAGDVVVLDNLLTAHGREPYAGGWDVVASIS
jgi:alpha-ketoglutarate-dependent taurine dioxygenase